MSLAAAVKIQTRWLLQAPIDELHAEKTVKIHRVKRRLPWSQFKPTLPQHESSRELRAENAENSLRQASSLRLLWSQSAQSPQHVPSSKLHDRVKRRHDDCRDRVLRVLRVAHYFDFMNQAKKLYQRFKTNSVLGRLSQGVG